MVMNQKLTGTASAMPSGLLKGALVGIGITLVGAAVMSALILREVLRETAIGYSAMGVILVSAFAGAMAAMNTVKQRPAVVAVLSGLIYYAVLLGANALFFKGEYEGLGVTALLVLAGVGTALLLKMKPRKGRRPSVRKNRHR